jgi:lipopolysaccharide export system permease protein
MLPRFLRPRPLDRYVFAEWWKIFVTTSLGFPVLVIVIDLVDHLNDYLSRNIPPMNIALSYLFWLPDSMFLVLPAAVLFATVFSIGAFTRYSEITAAKASGISFYRLTAPIYAGASIAVMMGLGLSVLVPITNAKRNDLLQESQFKSGTDRFNFTYAAPEGRVYRVSALSSQRHTIDGLAIERKGSGPDYPTVMLTANHGDWSPQRGWAFNRGVVHVYPDSTRSFTVQFDSVRDNRFKETPADLMAIPRKPEDLGYQDLSRYIKAAERSGSDAAELRVERAQKIAVPMTCIIIVMFGAALATSTQRGGAAYGVGVSLATTITFLMMIQLTKGVGSKGLIPPDLAAWIPNVLFGVAGAYLLARVRT